ncbi:Uncharacterized protein Fot_02225 [Forsythia ovata]|uniref:Uncharacterized protein n=1 Tax=Forsythia ovata TaxID=205694 RepID=A0ABD1X688_9LAMI
MALPQLWPSSSSIIFHKSLLNPANYSVILPSPPPPPAGTQLPSLLSFLIFQKIPHQPPKIRRCSGVAVVSPATCSFSGGYTPFTDFRVPLPHDDAHSPPN